MNRQSLEQINEAWAKAADGLVEGECPGVLPNMWDRLTEARKHAKMSQAELASAIGITQTTLSHWERAYKLPDSAKPFLLMSMALDVSIDYLFYNDDMPSALSAKEKKTLEEAAEILSRVYAKK